MRASGWILVGGLCLVGCHGGAKSEPRDDDNAPVTADAGTKPPVTSPNKPFVPVDKDAAAAPEGGCELPPAHTEIVNSVDKVDVLFMVDDSPSMKEEQQNLADNLPLLVESLASGQLKDGNGKVIKTFPAVKSLHLGVITSNLGVNGAPTRTGGGGAIFSPTQSCDGFGDDGRLLDVPSSQAIAVDPTCDRAFPRYLEYPSKDTTPEQLGGRFGCVAMTGMEGCGFEQQLEATWKALAPSTNKTFSRGTRGHGEDSDFLRPDSVLAIVLVTDEEDSSIPDESMDLFNVLREQTSDGAYTEQPLDKSRVNLRHYNEREKLHPVSRYIEGFKSLRPKHPELVVFAGIVGVPVAASDLKKAGIQDFDAILKLPEMQFSEQPVGNIFLPTPVCINTTVSPESHAYPAPRFVEVAKAFGRNGSVHSICDDDFSGALSALVERISRQLEITTGGCTTDSDCPADWYCAIAPDAGTGQCVNPGCGIK